MSFSKPSVDGQSTSGFAVTPSDATVFTSPFPSHLFIGTAGNVNVETVEGQTLLFKNIGNASYLMVRPKRVLATLTTAQDIVALT